jgi:hypothetical protein
VQLVETLELFRLELLPLENNSDESYNVLMDDQHLIQYFRRSRWLALLPIAAMLDGFPIRRANGNSKKEPNGTLLSSGWDIIKVTVPCTWVSISEQVNSESTGEIHVLIWPPILEIWPFCEDMQISLVTQSNSAILQVPVQRIDWMDCKPKKPSTGMAVSGLTLKICQKFGECSNG